MCFFLEDAIFHFARRSGREKVFNDTDAAGVVVGLDLRQINE